MSGPWCIKPFLLALCISGCARSAASDELPDVAGKLRAVLVADVHHVARAVISIDDPVLRDAGPGQRIFGSEEGGREVEIALPDEQAQPRILPHRPAQIGRDVLVVARLPALVLEIPVPVADPADRRILPLRPELEAVPDPGVERRGIAGVDSVEAGIVVRRLAGIEIGRASR